MKSNELRIGNLFYPINRSNKIHIPDEIPMKICIIGFKIEAVLYIYNYASEEKWNTYKLSDMSPIPLTEKYLRRFGFNKKAGIYGYLWVLNHIEIAETSKGFFIESGFDNKKSKLLKYVHELQNYCFFNYDEEIILKEI